MTHDRVGDFGCKAMRLSGRDFPSLCAIVAILVAIPAVALSTAGVPPFEWFAGGKIMEEYHTNLSVRSEVGFSGGYAGNEGDRSMKVENYLAAPVLIRYGLWGSLEAYVSVPVYWGSSPQRYTDRLASPPREYAGTVSGFDIGDTAAALRWRVWESATEEWTTLLSGGVVMPLGSNVWNEYPDFTYIRTAPDRPDLAVGDGSWKILVAVQELFERDEMRAEALIGYIHKFPLRARAAELSVLHEITVRQPSPLVAWIRPAMSVGDGLWLTGRIEGFWAPRGSLSAGGILAKSPGSMEKILDSYANLVGASGAAWVGGGVRWEVTDTGTVSLEVAAPVAAHRAYRYWRASARITYALKQ